LVVGFGNEFLNGASTTVPELAPSIEADVDDVVVVAEDDDDDNNNIDDLPCDAANVAEDDDDESRASHTSESSSCSATKRSNV
jgi:hypothetical protein